MTEVEGWSTDPEDWPSTPPLYVFKQLYELDENLIYRIRPYDARGLLEQALDML